MVDRSVVGWLWGGVGVVAYLNCQSIGGGLTVMRITMYTVSHAHIRNQRIAYAIITPH